MRRDFCLLPGSGGHCITGDSEREVSVQFELRVAPAGRLTQFRSVSGSLNSGSADHQNRNPRQRDTSWNPLNLRTAYKRIE